jgi:Rrf2 family protein
MPITRAADYAVRVMVHLACLPPDARVQRKALVHLSEAPGSFLSKVLQKLVSTGLAQSRRGSGGGFELSQPAEQISILRVIEAIDGPLHLNLCVTGGSGCSRQASCAVHPVWERAQAAIVQVLEGTTIADLSREPGTPRDAILTFAKGLGASRAAGRARGENLATLCASGRLSQI